MSQNAQPVNCPKCGASLPAQLPAGLCPGCLLGAGLEMTSPNDPEDTAVMPQTAAMSGIPQPGEDFGHYRLIRLLGQGGMGVVFEAEDHETGRRVALKILSQALDSPEARKRFLREGMTAAAINHPNSVYVFGTEEIAGTPVIAMELVGGGTLRDRVDTSGPLPATEAVDMMLQIIAGLEAAQQAGVLHRDIKPTNCFIDSDGTTKIGDFGLSISVSVRTESNLTNSGTLFGTPAFSSPEQLRGEELTVRSDIYSAGVTLYYLLTGRLPFEAPNIVQLLVRVIEKQPASPDSLRPGIPKGLARAVLACLNKDPLARPGSYAALRRSLQPYASASPSPATLPLRYVAWLIDHAVFTAVFLAAVLGGFTAMIGMSFFKYALLFGMTVLYFGLLEGLRGASLGKSICRLRVVGLDGRPPGVKRCLLRVLILSGFSFLPALALVLLSLDAPPKDAAHLNVLFASLMLFAMPMQLLIFCSCRRRNGMAGLHELWSRTRVLARSNQSVRPSLPPELEAPPATGEMPMVGPYHVLAELGSSDEATVWLGYDSRLLRKVWLRRVPAATPAVDTALRHLGRPGRLRWLNGRRSGDDAWDAYEAPAGQPLLNLIAAKQDWEQIRFWLLDLAAELKAGEKDWSLPPVLGLDRIWITADGHAKLLDFPAPGIRLPRATEPPQLPSVQAFFRQAAVSALEGRPLTVEQAHASALKMPLPLYARDFFQCVETEPNAGQIWARLKPLIGKVATVTRRRRGAMLGLTLAVPVFTMLGIMLACFLLMHSSTFFELCALDGALTEVKPSAVKSANAAGQPPLAEAENRKLETYIAGRFRPLITNAVVWNGSLARMLILPEKKSRAENIIAAHPQTTPAEFAAVKTEVESRFHIFSTVPAQFFQDAKVRPKVFSWQIQFTFAMTWMFIALPGLAAALLFRGGLVMHGLGIVVVGRNGRPSRLRTLWRNFIAWLPFFLSPVLGYAADGLLGPKWGTPAVAGLLAALALLSLLLRRSLPDRLAGTWLVPGGAISDVADLHFPASTK